MAKGKKREGKILGEIAVAMSENVFYVVNSGPVRFDKSGKMVEFEEGNDMET